MLFFQIVEFSIVKCKVHKRLTFLNIANDSLFTAIKQHLAQHSLIATKYSYETNNHNNTYHNLVIVAVHTSKSTPTRYISLPVQ